MVIMVAVMLAFEEDMIPAEVVTSILILIQDFSELGAFHSFFELKQSSQLFNGQII